MEHGITAQNVALESINRSKSLFILFSPKLFAYYCNESTIHDNILNRKYPHFIKGGNGKTN